ncbi:hypothetical protein GQ55_2G402000 [Panicum hallii var. hallii]|uniref:Uncharacterized protein n=1 Tax=Panicum hallii var. hallii TaxID=1504633 RepID=A0A2T7EXI6_9POAL|nr:hypothetical protein GQ55_2G402000 [Panicum hallii var. hallii]
MQQNYRLLYLPPLRLSRPKTSRAFLTAQPGPYGDRGPPPPGCPVSFVSKHLSHHRIDLLATSPAPAPRQAPAPPPSTSPADASPASCRRARRPLRSAIRLLRPRRCRLAVLERRGLEIRPDPRRIPFAGESSLGPHVMGQSMAYSGA